MFFVDFCTRLSTVYSVRSTQYRVQIYVYLVSLWSLLLVLILMAGVRLFTELLYWQKSREWSKVIFTRTKEQPFCEDRRLVAQINDSSESVMANIAEGFGRGTQGEFIQFLGYALGSLNETQAHLTAAYDREYLVGQCTCA